MELITPLSDFDSIKSRGLIFLRCKVCGGVFTAVKSQVQKVLKKCSLITLESCSVKCAAKLRDKKIQMPCQQCGKPVFRREKEIPESGFCFCNKSCSARYSNAHKTTGTRRSKLEKWIELELKKRYPTLEIHFNKNEAISAELDIYIPSLKLAVELNGIFHYEPIFSEEKLEKIQNNDQRKLQACAERGISFCVIDTSSQKIFKEKTSLRFLEIITTLIDGKLGSLKAVAAS